MNKIWDSFLDVVILPPLEMRDYAISLSAKLHRHGTPWMLGLEERRPHLSLFHFPISPKSGGENVIAVLSRLMRGGTLHLTGISSPRHGAVFLNTDRPAWLVNAAEETSRTLWKCGIAERDPCFMERWQQMELSPRMEKNIAKWGSPLMSEDFLPHFTLGVLGNRAQAAEIVASLPFRPMSWTVDRFHVVQVGDGWTAGDVLGEGLFL